MQHELAGVYDAYGTQLSQGHLAAHHAALLGSHLMNMVARHHELALQAATHLAEPEHPVHQERAKAEAELADASHARLSGLWSIDRYDAPIERYAYRLMNNTGYGVTVGEDAYAALDFNALPASVQAAADLAMKRDVRASRSEFADTFENLFLTVGVTMMWQQAIGTTISANSGGSPAGTYAYLNNTQARICVGDSSTAASAGQTWLQAVTNKFCVVMDATFPTQTTNQAVFRATFGSGNGNYAWQEFVIDNNGGSNATSTTQSGGSALDRVVSNQGTKASGQTWQPSMTLSIS